MSNLVANNVLYFLASEYDKENNENIISTLNDFYLPEELTAAKAILIDECQKLSISDAITKFSVRRQLAKNDGVLKTVKDIVNIWSVIDIQTSSLH